MAEITHDPKTFQDAYLDTPFQMPGGETIEDATINPGNCVKEIQGDIHSRLFGRLVSYSEDKVVIRGHTNKTDPKSKFVWTGTASEYLAMWTVD